MVRPLGASWIGGEDIGSRDDGPVGASERIWIAYESSSTLSYTHVQGIPLGLALRLIYRGAGIPMDAWWTETAVFPLSETFA